MVRLVLIILSYFAIGSVWANNAVLKLITATDTIHKGDVYKGTIEVYPVKDGERQKYYFLSGKEIEKKIKVLTIDTVIPNTNNVDVLEVRGLYMIMDVFDPEKPLLLNVEGRETPLRIKIKSVGNTVQNNRELIILEQDKNSLPWGTITWTIIGLLIFIASVLGFDYWNKKKKEKLEEEKRAREFALWNEVFSKASSRSDFENIYAQKEKWLNLVEIQTPPIIEFKRIMHEHQYKAEWSKNELMDVKFTFDNIKGIFR